eukprot:6467988-Amphidinium_carterae.2
MAYHTFGPPGKMIGAIYAIGRASYELVHRAVYGLLPWTAAGQTALEAEGLHSHTWLTFASVSCTRIARTSGGCCKQARTFERMHLWRHLWARLQGTGGLQGQGTSSIWQECEHCPLLRQHCMGNQEDDRHVKLGASRRQRASGSPGRIRLHPTSRVPRLHPSRHGACRCRPQH